MLQYTWRARHTYDHAPLRAANSRRASNVQLAGLGAWPFTSLMRSTCGPSADCLPTCAHQCFLATITPTACRAVGPEGQPAWTKKKVAFRLTHMWGFCKGFLLLKTNQWTKENAISYSFRRTPLDNINLKQTHFALPGKRPPMSRSCRHGCGVCVRLRTLPRSLRALPPSNVVCCVCCSSALGCHDGHCHDLDIGGGGAARNTSLR